MLRLLTIHTLLLAHVSLVSADVKFIAPAAGASIVGGTAFTVAWAETGDAPALADLSSYTLFLFSGSNTAPTQLYQLSASTFAAAGKSVSVTVPVNTGGVGTNAYFLGMLSVATAGGTVWNYSNRFTLTGMTGTFDPTVAAAVKAVSGSTGPPSVNKVAQDADPIGTSVGEGAWATPYNMQIGNTKYAPMQPVPPTTITATNLEPLWPTSAVRFASTFLPLPSQVTTLTQANTYSISSRANTAIPASSPVDEMERYLNRWKD
ncbi:related to KRE9 Cell wall synthesis protein [Rhynchosporium secalis]|uniref:Related to KRE9 Cell wall synthesis protein n=1 Tax=Rhynchosporium secalis TaxID=38038 RepID=A0A1E1MW39_RHYSE|nr:related to KRE9 Cell wall synthesis protein [Rhynchosporium secalis]